MRSLARRLARIILGPSMQPFFTRDQFQLAQRSGHVDIGEFTYGRPRIVGIGRAFLKVGKYCSIAENVTIILADHNPSAFSTFPFENIGSEGALPSPDIDVHARTKGPVIIGNDVWIGTNVIILPGTTISDGAVIGAGSVCSGHYDPYSISVGAKATTKGFRFDSETIERLGRLKWWDLPDASIREVITRCGMDNVEDLLREFESLIRT